MDRKFVLTGLVYALIGLSLGIFMGISEDHGQMVTHAHIMLIGFVVSVIYGVCHKLWLPPVKSLLSSVQFMVHQCGTVLLLGGLFLVYGGFVNPELLGPWLGVFSIIVFTGMILMAVMFWKSQNKAS